MVDARGESLLIGERESAAAARTAQCDRWKH
jgi:hypothetical protein